MFLLMFSACADDGDLPAIDAAPVGPDAPPSPVDERPYRMVVPQSYDPATPTPLVVLLHGYGATGLVQDLYWGISDAAEAEGFLLATPDGTVDSTNKQFWNATNACCDFDGTNVDDVAYLTAVLDDVEAGYNVDPKRVYFVGHSNGGFMSHRMACELAPRIAGIVSLAGHTWKDGAQCPAAAEVAVLQIHGDADATVPYAGNAFQPSAAEDVAFWATRNGCDATREAGGTLDLDMDVAGAETTVERHPGCDAAAAELWTIVGGGHIPAVQPIWATSIYGFLAAHPKP